jgi:hypothetical protein
MLTKAIFSQILSDFTSKMLKFFRLKEIVLIEKKKRKEKGEHKTSKYVGHYKGCSHSFLHFLK